jgi:flagella basal body P-ring formation protein FlgA
MKRRTLLSYRLAGLALAGAVLAPVAAAQVRVTGDWVALGDVAPVTGAAAKILVAAAPPVGETLALDPAFIVSVAQKSGVILALPLDQPIWVSRGNAPQAQVARVAPTAPVAPTPPSATLGGDQPEPGWILVLARDVDRGRTLGRDDLKWADPKTLPAARNGVTDMATAIGMDVKRALRAGIALQSNDLQPTAAVRKGAPVRLIYSAPGLRISTEGVAQADAYKGESIRVLNTFTKRTLSATVTGAGEASVSSTQERS